MRARNEQGAVLVIVLLVLLVLSVLGVATMYLAGNGTTLAISSRMDDQALRAAEAGQQYAMQWAQNQGAATVLSLANANYKTVGYGGPSGNPDVNILDNGTTVPVTDSLGATVNMHAAFQLGPSQLMGQPAVKCGIVGFSDKYGEFRFKVTSRGYGPGGTTSELEAHVYLPPSQGLCPPAAFVANGYSGS